MDRHRLPLLELLTEPKISPRELGAGDGRWWLQLLLAPIHHHRGHKAEYQSHLPAFNCAKFQVTIKLSPNLKVSKAKFKFCNAVGVVHKFRRVWVVTLSSDTYRRTMYLWGAPSTYFWFEDEEGYGGICVVFLNQLSCTQQVFSSGTILIEWLIHMRHVIDRNIRNMRWDSG